MALGTMIGHGGGVPHDPCHLDVNSPSKHRITRGDNSQGCLALKACVDIDMTVDSEITAPQA
jgi:hypothetical protein